MKLYIEIIRGMKREIDGLTAFELSCHDACYITQRCTHRTPVYSQGVMLEESKGRLLDNHAQKRESPTPFSREERVSEVYVCRLKYNRRNER
jgi:hypothetical protein